MTQSLDSRLTRSLPRKLEREGIIERSTKPTSPPTVWYALTPAGKELCEALVNVIDVALRVRPADARV